MEDSKGCFPKNTFLGRGGEAGGGEWQEERKLTFLLICPLRTRAGGGLKALSGHPPLIRMM